MLLDKANKLCREYEGGDLDLSGLTSAKGLTLPQSFLLRTKRPAGCPTSRRRRGEGEKTH